MIEKIYKQYRPFLLRFLSKYVDSDDAEDILQDVFLRFTINHRKKPILKVGPWLMQVARNLLVDRARVHHEMHSPESVSEEGVVSVILDAIADDSWSADYDLNNEELRKAIISALKKLPPAQRYIITLTEIEGKSFKDLSIMFNAPVNTLLSRKHKGIIALRKALNEFVKP